MNGLSALIINTIWAITAFTRSYGISIILFALFLKLLLLPATLYGMFWQERFKTYMKKAKEEIASITTTNPAKRDDQILDIYQKNGINFLNQCKALLPLLIQLPLLIAFYRTVTHWDVMNTTSFLWMQDLSEADSLFSFGVVLPWMGATFNVLPFMLFAVNASEVVLFRDSRLQWKSFTLPVVFFFLFYPFPASCMIFWVTLNVLHVPELYCFRRILQKKTVKV